MMRFVARYADQWDGHYATPDEYVQLGQRLSAYCNEIGRAPAEIRRMRQTGRQELDLVEDEERFRNHVISYVRAGVRSFIFSVPPGPPNATLRHLSERVIPELRVQFEAGEMKN
jgi:alkanesulfonate monooxygenase SsuD/methylene tetrahydromethanopterin reductase-like flavin-dependent oxidoreductase (luciferase family)